MQVPLYCLVLFMSVPKFTKNIIKIHNDTKLGILKMILYQITVTEKV